MAALFVANQLLMAAVKIWESDPDSPYVLGLTLNALAFIADAVGHAHVAGGDPGEASTGGSSPACYAEEEFLVGPAVITIHT